ncbi:extensin-like [Salvia divinorum]|uniref:Extensin-like n=1 Tax=Salvia divinorum TaxID=28513 RepID=A0ABD1FVX5_SALDI
MSYDYVGYHPHQYNLPQPVQPFHPHTQPLPDPKFPYRTALPHNVHSFQPPPYGHPPFVNEGFATYEPPTYTVPNTYIAHQQHHPYQARQSTCWDPPWSCQTTAYQHTSSYEPHMYSLPPPRRRSTCWDPPAYWETSGQGPFHEISAYDQPLPPDPNSSWNQLYTILDTAPQPASRQPSPATTAANPIVAKLDLLLKMCNRMESRAYTSFEPYQRVDTSPPLDQEENHWQQKPLDQEEQHWQQKPLDQEEQHPPLDQEEQHWQQKPLDQEEQHPPLDQEEKHWQQKSLDQEEQHPPLDQEEKHRQQEPLDQEEEALLDDEEEVDSSEEVKKVVISFNFNVARVPSQDSVENCWMTERGAHLRSVDGDDKGRRSTIRCTFDPGGIPRQSFCFRLSSLLCGFHLEDKVDFNRGGVDTSISTIISLISLLFSLLLF